MHGVRLTVDSKFPVGVNRCLPLCISPVTDWWLIQGVSQLGFCDSGLNKWGKNGWIEDKATILEHMKRLNIQHRLKETQLLQTNHQFVSVWEEKALCECVSSLRLDKICFMNKVLFMWSKERKPKKERIRYLIDYYWIFHKCCKDCFSFYSFTSYLSLRESTEKQNSNSQHANWMKVQI